MGMGTYHEKIYQDFLNNNPGYNPSQMTPEQFNFQKFNSGPNAVNATQDPWAAFQGPRTNVGFNPAGQQTYGGSDREYLRITDKYNLQRQFTDQAFDKARGLQGEQMARTGKGFDEAKAYLGQYGESAKRSTLEREDQLAAELGAMHGGGHGQAFDRRGLAAETNRVLASIDESIGAQFSGLSLARADRESGLLGGMAGSYLAQAQVYQSLLSQEQSLLGGYAPSAGSDNSGWYELAGALAQAGAYYAGSKAG